MRFAALRMRSLRCGCDSHPGFRICVRGSGSCTHAFVFRDAADAARGAANVLHGPAGAIGALKIRSKGEHPRFGNPGMRSEERKTRFEIRRPRFSFQRTRSSVERLTREMLWMRFVVLRMRLLVCGCILLRCGCDRYPDFAPGYGGLDPVRAGSGFAAPRARLAPLQTRFSVRRIRFALPRARPSGEDPRSLVVSI
jgi:hypothetical protein